MIREGTRGGAKQWNSRGTRQKRYSEDIPTFSSCDREQMPTMFAGPAGVAQVVCTKLGPLDSSWVIGLKDCQSCKSNVVRFKRPTTMPYTPT